MPRDHLDRLFRLPRFGTGPGLHRMAALRAALPASSGSLPEAIKICGSNGKGTVAAMTAAILDALDLACGLYTSPHFLRVQERIAVAGQPVSEAELAAATAWVLEAKAAYERAHPGDAVGAFEALTAAALFCFQRRQPEVVVAEAGIGGRLDSIQVFSGRLSALTSLDLEHAPLLGSTLEAIAYEKAALCPDGGTLVAGRLEPEILRRLEGALALRGVSLRRATEEVAVGRVEMEPVRMWMDLELASGLTLAGVEVGLVGPHQVDNAAVAVLLVSEWLRTHRPGIGSDRLAAAIRRGLAELRWPGRFERLAPRQPEEAEVFVDVGHTPEAVAALAATVAAVLGDRPLVLVAGVSRGRDPEALLAPLLERADLLICARPRHRGATAAQVAEAARRSWPKLPVDLEEGEGERVEAALDRALAASHRLGPTAVVLVAGGYFLAAEAAVAHAGGDPGELRFF